MAETADVPAQLLAYPPTDFDGGYPSRAENATGYMLTTKNIADIQHLSTPATTLRSAPHLSRCPLGTNGINPVTSGAKYDGPIRALRAKSSINVSHV
ncbi:hypothetical protein P3T29_001827 [Kitasatospora sp. MAP5-34]|nr:hypothetical protein [Kitasatospora sp. MAP5-34]